MKDLLVGKIIDNIKRKENYSNIKLLEIKYGLENIYIFITKTIVIFLIAYILSIFKNLLIIMIFYTILRLTAFGVHAKKSWHCWISSILIFIGIPILSTFITIPKNICLIISILCLILLLIYAPADTEKRPIVNKKRRMIYKIITSITALCYILLFVFTNDFLANSIFIALVIETIMVLPITYIIFNLKYNNYKSYLNKSLSKIEKGGIING